MNKDFNSKKEMILEFLYSNDPANDLLAFEMIKHLEKDKMLLIALVCIQVRISDFELLEDIKNYLAKDIFSDFFPGRERLAIRFFVRYDIGPIEYSRLRVDLSHKEIMDILFFLIRRRREVEKIGLIKFFLIYDNGEHPNRKIVVDMLINRQLKKQSEIEICGLFYEELEEFTNICLLVRKRRVEGLLITDLKTNSLPSFIQEYRFSKIVIKSLKQKTISVLPEYIYSFKHINTLELSINDLNIFQKSIKKRIGIGTLLLQCNPNVEITNFDCLDLFIKLEAVYISSGLISHPRTLLGLGNVRVEGDMKFKSTAGYKINMNERTVFRTAHLLNTMPLSMQEREYFFLKYLALRDSKNASFFSDKDLKRLEEFPLFYIHEKWIMYLAIQKEIALRNLGQEIDAYLNKI